MFSQKRPVLNKGILFEITRFFLITLVAVIATGWIIGYFLHEKPENQRMERMITDISENIFSKILSNPTIDNIEEISKEYDEVFIAVWVENKEIFNNFIDKKSAIINFSERRRERNGFNQHNYNFRFLKKSFRWLNQKFPEQIPRRGQPVKIRKNDNIINVFFMGRSVNISVGIKVNFFGRKIIRPLILLGGIIGVIIFILYWFVYRLLSPVKELHTAVKKIGEGDFEYKLSDNPGGEFQSLYEAFNKMGEKIQRLFSSHLLLAGNISHDLKYYLTRLKMQIELEIDEETLKRSLIEDIDSMTDYLERSLQAFKTASRKDLYQFEVVCIPDLVGDIGVDYNIFLKEKIKEPLWKVDPEKFSLVIHNLIDNAVKYGKDVNIEFEKDNDEYQLKIINKTDKYFNNDELAMLFQPFFRGDSGGRSQEKKGNGMGLFICKQIMDAHNMTIDIQCTNEKIFIVTIKENRKE